MKLAVVFLFCLIAGSFAQTVSNWDLSELNSVTQADKAPPKILDRKATNQGFTSQISQGEKSNKLKLTVTKERSPHVTDLDQLLFGLSIQDIDQADNEYTNVTFTREETENVVRTVLGENWESQVSLPEEELTYIELLRLGASLNEYTLVSGNAHGRARGYKWPYRCICQGTTQPYPANRPPWKKGPPYYGIRVIVPGYPVRQTGKYRPSCDCILCDPNNANTQQTDTNIKYDCRYCCFGKCVVTYTGPSGWPDDLDVCDMDFTLDDDTENPKYGYPNYVGRCVAPQTVSCPQAVSEQCESCTDVLEYYVQDQEDNGKKAVCNTYCDKAVGWSDYFCKTCATSIDAIDSQFECSCNEVFWHLAHPGKGSPEDYDTNTESGYWKESGGYWKESGSESGSGYWKESGSESGSYWESGSESGSYSESGHESGNSKYYESGKYGESGSYWESGSESGSWKESGSESGSYWESGSESGSWKESGSESGSYHYGESGESGSYYGEKGYYGESGSYYWESGSESGSYSESGSRRPYKG